MKRYYNGLATATQYDPRMLVHRNKVPDEHNRKRLSMHDSVAEMESTQGQLHAQVVRLGSEYKIRREHDTRIHLQQANPGWQYAIFYEIAAQQGILPILQGDEQ